MSIISENKLSNPDSEKHDSNYKKIYALSGSVGAIIASIPSHVTMEKYIRNQLGTEFSLFDSQMWLNGAQPPSSKYMPRGVFQEVSKVGVISPVIYSIAQELTQKSQIPVSFPFISGLIAAGVRLPIDITNNASKKQVAMANFTKYSLLTGVSGVLKSVKPEIDSTSLSVAVDFSISLASATVAKIGDDSLVAAKDGKSVTSLFEKGLSHYFNGAYKKGFVPKTFSTAIAFFGFTAGQSLLAEPIEGICQRNGIVLQEGGNCKPPLIHSNLNVFPKDALCPLYVHKVRPSNSKSDKLNKSDNFYTNKLHINNGKQVS